MTLLGAVQSLGIVESAALSWISIRQVGARYVAVFTMALLLPFADPELPTELAAGGPRFWPDQVRLLDSEPPIRDQIRELESSRLLGDLDSVYLRPVEGEARPLWIIETHAGSREERAEWLRSVIEMEGRNPY
jgi:hypothetical protein